MTLTQCMQPGICHGFECRYCGLHVDECVDENEACLQDEQYKTDLESVETSTGKIVRTMAHQRLVFGNPHTMLSHNGDHTGALTSDLPLSNARQPDLDTFTFHTAGVSEPVEDVIIYSTDTPSPRFTIRTIPRPLATPSPSEVSVDTGELMQHDHDISVDWGDLEVIQLDEDEVLVDEPVYYSPLQPMSDQLSLRDSLDRDSLGNFSSDGSVSECTEIPVSFATEVVIPAKGPAKTVISFYPHGEIEESPGRRSVRRVAKSMISDVETTSRRKIYYRREDVNHHVPKVLDKRKGGVGVRESEGVALRRRPALSPDLVFPSTVETSATGRRAFPDIVTQSSPFPVTGDSVVITPSPVPSPVRLVPDADLYRVFYPDRLRSHTPLTAASHVPRQSAGTPPLPRSHSQPPSASLSPVERPDPPRVTNRRPLLVNGAAGTESSVGQAKGTDQRPTWTAQRTTSQRKPVLASDGVVNGASRVVKEKPEKRKVKVEWDETVVAKEGKRKELDKRRHMKADTTGKLSTDVTSDNTMPASTTQYSLHKTPIVHNKFSPLLSYPPPQHRDRDGDASTLSSVTLPFSLADRARLAHYASSKASSVSELLENYPVSPSPSLADSALSYTSRGSGNRVSRRSHATIYLNDEEQQKAKKSRSKVDLTVASEAGMEREEVRKFPVEVEQEMVRRSSSASSSTSSRGAVQKMTIKMLLTEKRAVDEVSVAVANENPAPPTYQYASAPVRSTSAGASLFRSQLLPVKLADGELQRRACSYNQRHNKQQLSASEVELCRPEYLVSVHQHHPQIMSTSTRIPLYERRTPSRVVISREGRELEAVASKSVPYRSYERLDVENEDGARVTREVCEELKNNVVTVQVHEKGDKLSKDKLAEVKNDELKDSIATNGKIGKVITSTVASGQLALLPEKPPSPPRSRREKYEVHQAMSWKRDIELRPSSGVDERSSSQLTVDRPVSGAGEYEPVSVREVTRVAEARAISAPSYNVTAAAYQRPASPVRPDQHTSMISSTMSSTTTTHRSIQYRSIFDKSYTDGRVSGLRKSAGDLRALAAGSVDDTPNREPYTAYSSSTYKHPPPDYRRPLTDYNTEHNSTGDFSYKFPGKTPSYQRDTVDYKENILPTKSSERVKSEYTDYAKPFKCSYPVAEKPVTPPQPVKCNYPPAPPVRYSSRLGESSRTDLLKEQTPVYDKVPSYRATEKDPTYRHITQYKSTPLLTGTSETEPVSSTSTFVREYVRKQDDSFSYKPRQPEPSWDRSRDALSESRAPTFKTAEKTVEKRPGSFLDRAQDALNDSRTSGLKTAENRPGSFLDRAQDSLNDSRSSAFKAPEKVTEKRPGSFLDRAQDTLNESRTPGFKTAENRPGSFLDRAQDSLNGSRASAFKAPETTGQRTQSFGYESPVSKHDSVPFTTLEKTTEKRSESFSYKSFEPTKISEPLVVKQTIEPRSSGSSWAYAYKLPDDVHVRTSSQSSAGTLPRDTTKKSLEPAILESLRTKKPSPPSSPDIRPKDWVPPCKAKILQAKRKYMSQQPPVAPPVRIDPWDKHRSGSRDKTQLRMSRESLEAINREANRGSIRRDNRYSMPDLRGSQKTLADPGVYRSKIAWPEREIQRKLSESQEYLERRGRADYDTQTSSFANRWDSRSRSLPPMSRYSKSAATTPTETPYPEYIDSNKAKSMEFLVDVKKYDYRIVPENQLQRENISGYSRSRPGDEKEDNQYVEQVRKSLQKLDLPEWYVNSPYSQPGVMEGTLLRHRAQSATDSNYSPYNTLDRSELTSPTGTLHSSDAVVISKRILPDYPKSNVSESKKSLSASREDKVWDLYTGPFYNKKSRPTPIYSPASESHSHRPYNPHDSGWSSDWNSHHESSQDSDESNTESRTSPRNWTAAGARTSSDWYRSPLGERRRDVRPLTEGPGYNPVSVMYYDPITQTERRVLQSTPWEVTSVKTETFKTERLAKKNFVTETNDPVKIGQFSQDNSQWGSYV